jgi:hypothetical protein
LYTVRLSIDTTRVAGALSLSKIRYGFDGALHLEGKCLARHASPARLSSVACFVDMVISPLLRESVMPRKMTVKPGLFQRATIFICCARKDILDGNFAHGPSLVDALLRCITGLGHREHTAYIARREPFENTRPQEFDAGRVQFGGDGDRRALQRRGITIAPKTVDVRFQVGFMLGELGVGFLFEPQIVGVAFRCDQCRCRVRQFQLGDLIAEREFFQPVNFRDGPVPGSDGTAARQHGTELQYAMIEKAIVSSMASS